MIQSFGQTHDKLMIPKTHLNGKIIKVNDSDALIYSMNSSSRSDSNFKFETFDPLLHTRISGFRGKTQTNAIGNGTSILRTKSLNSTHRTIEASFLTRTQTNSSTEGEEFKRSIFGSGWKDASETESTVSRDNTTNLWTGESNGSNWLKIEDQVFASITSYSEINTTELESGNQDITLTGLEEALNITNYKWERGTETIVMPQQFQDWTNSEQAILYEFYNSSSKIYRDQTDDIFDNVPYNITRSLSVKILEDPISNLYLRTIVELYFHMDFKAKGQVTDKGLGSLVDADIELNLSTWSNNSYSLTDYIVPRQNDNVAPSITEKWIDELPENPSWKVNDTGFINVTVLVDNKLERTQVFLDEGELGYNLKEVEWNNLTLLAIDEFNNTNSLFYQNPNKWQPSKLTVVGIILALSVILLIVTSSLLKTNVLRLIRKKGKRNVISGLIITLSNRSVVPFRLQG